MDAEMAWGAAFVVYILLGLYPMSESGVKEPDHLGNEVYRQRFSENFMRRNGLLFAWCIGLAVLIVAWKLFS